MKRGFPQKIEPLLPPSLGKDALQALTELAAASSAGITPSADVLDQVRRLNPDEIASVVREAGGEDWVERYLKPILMSADCQRRLRTSAAVMGLALSMGASDILSLMRTQALAAEASSSEVASSDRAEELALELQKLAESAAAVVEEGDLGNFSTTPSELLALEENRAPQKVAAAFPQVESATSYHVVQPGETVSSLARSYSVSTTQIVAVNHLTDAASIKVGQTLQIPANAADKAQVATTASVGTSDVELSQLKPYQIKQGDTLASIARSYDVSRADIISVNQLQNPNALKVDQVIALPRNASATPVQSQRQVLASQPLESKASLPTPPSLVSAVSPAVQPSTQAAPVVPEVEALATYRVQPGDTLAKIARKNGISISELSRANKITDPNFIFVGQSLNVPGGVRNSSATRQALQKPDIVAARTATSLSQDSSESFDSSRYVSGLMGEIRQLREKYQAPSEVASDLKTPIVPEPVREAEPKVAAQPVTPQRTANTPSSKPNRYLAGLEAELRELRSNAQGGKSAAVAKAPSSGSSDRISVQLPQVKPQPKQEPQVVAAASLGSQSYEPLAQSLLSRSVAPELPPLLSEPYLPNGVLRGYIWPAEGVLSSRYGWRWGRMHKGIDIAGPVGTPILAAGGGVVTYAGWNSGGYGNLVEVTHPDGSVSLYAHNSRIMVREGQRVRQGQQIASMGSTGNSTGPHLHFEIHSPGKGAVNPVGLLPQK